MPHCPRVEMRMECPECGYPFCEAMYPLDKRLPHMEEEDMQIVDKEIALFENKLRLAGESLDDGFGGELDGSAGG